ncbi:MAG: group II intron reverse transcriptase domain-containing protein [Deltaproteobacteria bacterium]|nr:group II intron reverse transcriptase domain-containing protein [Deltaproteobacteria bacterium]
MRSAKHLWPAVASPEALDHAWRKARRGKRYRASAARFELDAETELRRLLEELEGGSYRPGRHRLIFLREPKRRVIAAAPFRDRVVHHAVHEVLEPILARSFLDDSFACRPGKGTQRAILQHVALSRNHRFRQHVDVRAFFASVDLDQSFALVAQRVRDPRFLDLLSAILEGGLRVYRDPAALAYLSLERPTGDRRGLPIGNLTSQLLANAYLDGVDHFIKRELRVRGYVRYMDDLTLFGNDAARLEEQTNEVRDWLAANRGLTLKPGAGPRPSVEPTTFLGCLVSPEGARLSESLLARIGRKAARLSNDPVRLERALGSWRALGASISAFGG